MLRKKNFAKHIGRKGEVELPSWTMKLRTTSKDQNKYGTVAIPKPILDEWLADGVVWLLVREVENGFTVIPHPLRGAGLK